MINTDRHYKRVVSAMIKCRREGQVRYETFSDLDREMVGETKYEVTDVDSEVDSVVSSVKYWMNNYYKNRWENQPNYVEIFIEKKALQGVFEPICKENNIALGACKGYPSLTFIHDTMLRFSEAIACGKHPIILYFGDYDPSGEDIPRSLQENLADMGCDVELIRIALMKHQVIEWELPPAPAKKGDSRTANWDGLGQVELDAVEPRKLKRMCQAAIDSVFDMELYEELQEQEAKEKEEYKARIYEEIQSFK